MTEKEAAKHLLTYSTTMGSGQTTDEQHNEAKRIAIKALEQEPILDKIRAEIESKMETIIGRYDSTTPIYDMASYKVERNKVREECMEIIDKYRQEG